MACCESCDWFIIKMVLVEDLGKSDIVPITLAVVKNVMSLAYSFAIFFFTSTVGF